MPLRLYKRSHSSGCLQALAKKAITEKAALENYRHCRCGWWITGTTDDGRFVPRRALKVYTYEQACEAAKKMNQPRAVINTEVSLAHAREQWTIELKVRNVSDRTIEEYTRAANKVLAFARSRQVTRLRDVTPELLNDMRAGWVTSRNTHANEMGWITMFFKFCVRMGWRPDNPAKMVAPIARRKRRTDDEEEESETATLPLDEEGDGNYRRILAMIHPFLTGKAAPLGGRKLCFLPRNGLLASRPDHFYALCELMYETGLRVSDAIHFKRDRMIVDDQGGTYTTIQIKTGFPVTVFIAPCLVEKLRSLPLMEGRYLFFDGRKNWREFIKHEVYRLLRLIGNASGVEGVRPHRFRDSFAVNILNRGLHMEELQKLLGHKTVRTTEKYYAPFVTSRQKHLRARLLAARNAPANVVAIDGKRVG